MNYLKDIEKSFIHELRKAGNNIPTILQQFKDKFREIIYIIEGGTRKISIEDVVKKLQLKEEQNIRKDKAEEEKQKKLQEEMALKQRVDTILTDGEEILINIESGLEPILEEAETFVYLKSNEDFSNDFDNLQKLKKDLQSIFLQEYKSIFIKDLLFLVEKKIDVLVDTLPLHPKALAFKKDHYCTSRQPLLEHGYHHKNGENEIAQKKGKRKNVKRSIRKRTMGIEKKMNELNAKMTELESTKRKIRRIDETGNRDRSNREDNGNEDAEDISEQNADVEGEAEEEDEEEEEDEDEEEEDADNVDNEDNSGESEFNNLSQLDESIKEKAKTLSRLVRKRLQLQSEKIDEQKGASLLAMSSGREKMIISNNIKDGFLKDTFSNLLTALVGCKATGHDFVGNIVHRRSSSR